jgi:hypothetical protein
LRSDVPVCSWCSARYAWELAGRDDPDLPPLGHRLLRAISERIQQRAQLDLAGRPATGPPAPSVNAPNSPSTRKEVPVE